MHPRLCVRSLETMRHTSNLWRIWDTQASCLSKCPLVFPELPNTLRTWLITFQSGFAGNLYQTVTLETFLGSLRHERPFRKDSTQGWLLSREVFFCLMVLPQKNHQENWKIYSLFMLQIYTTDFPYTSCTSDSAQMKTSSMASLLVLKWLLKLTNGDKRQFWPKIFLSFSLQSCSTNSDTDQVLRINQENKVK